MRVALLIVFVATMTAVAADTPTKDEKAAMDYVAKWGGKATLDARFSADARVMAKFDSVTDAVLIGLKKYPQIGGVDTFDATRCTDKGFAALKELPNLRKLVIGKATLTPAAVSSIGECKELRHLALLNSGLTDAELPSLKMLTMLDHLTLSGNTRIGDKGMSTVKGFDRLQALHLNDTSITDTGFMELKALDGLRSLGVGGTKVTDTAAEKFADEMPNLRVVRR
jgi:Leucine-rich repeat (LRR) protein